jgi:DNA polymerase-3 subunit delta
MVFFMPIYLYWGEDEFAMSKAVAVLRDQVLAPDWMSFNYDKIPPEQSDGIIQGLNQVMTPPFGSGGRLVWLVDTPVTQQCSAQLLAELERTLPAIPEESVLLLTTRNKPDSRLKATKLIQKYAGEGVREFSLIPPWQTERLTERVQEAAAVEGVKLTPAGVEMLAHSVGNDSRQLFAELTKLKLYANSFGNQPLNDRDVAALVVCNTQNSLQLAAAIRQGKTSEALGIVSDLIARNEPALRIVATLVGQFRTWLWVKLMAEAGERDDVIAKAVEIGNPKRVYFLRQEVKSLSAQKLEKTLPMLLELEVSLKRGAEEISILQTKVIELCQILSSDFH